LLIVNYKLLFASFYTKIVQKQEEKQVNLWYYAEILKKKSLKMN